MKRATTLKVLAGTLVLILVASAFPLAEVAQKAAKEKRAAEANARDPSAGDLPGLDDLPFPVSAEGSLPPASPGDDGLSAPDGSSSRPGDASSASQRRAGASGSVLVSQVLGAAQMMGHKDLEVPELPVAKLASKDPLRAAILGWIAATGAVVPPDELERELARADALPLDIQRDVALLLLSATEATAMQRAALARLTPTEIAWIYANPEVAEALAQGIDSPETRAMAALAAMVDMRQSIAASLLLLEAVEATRGSLSKAEAAEAMDALAAAEIDDTTRAILEILAGSQGRATDKDKVLLAARLVARTSEIELPPVPAATTFAAALDELLAQTAQVPDASALADVKARAAALPDDLETAIARIIVAQAGAIKAANPAHLTPTGQAEALASVLLATAEALPVLEKYGLYWREAPAALRVSEWDPAARIGWAAHHAALFVTARDDITTLASVAPLLSGHELATARVPQRSFTDAFLAVAKESGFRADEAMLDEIARAQRTLDPAVRDAAAILLSGAAESARLHREAFARLSPEEKEFLQFGTHGLDALYMAPALSEADLDRLARATALASLVDERKLAQSGLVAAMATSQAKTILDGRDAYSTQSSVTQVATGLRGLFARFLPVQAAQAQSGLTCDVLILVASCPQEDVLLRITYPIALTENRAPAEWRAWTTMASGQGSMPYTCDERECVLFPRFAEGEANIDILVITGAEGKTYRPDVVPRTTCSSQLRNGVYQPGGGCRTEPVARYGAANIRLDLGGDDTYQLPVAMVGVNATLPVSLSLDVGGADRYMDPTSLYDGASPQLRDIGHLAGHPTQASALYGGAAILVDAQGSDIYDAPTRSQGYARFGLAILADLGGGDDLYRGREWVQGASSETFSLGSAILFDRAGNDEYSALTGHGYGLGGVLLDVGGDDTYANEDPAAGVPVVRLDVLPGGDITTLESRANNRVWIDGPGSISAGLGIDQEAILSTGQSDGDGWADVIEFLVGTDPEDPDDNPQTNPLGRARALVVDADGDGYPDYIERALSTDPEDGASYPAGFPSGIAVTVPGEVMNLIPGDVSYTLGLDRSGRVAPFEETSETTGSNFTSSDKIVDLRLPLQDAGTIDYACTGQFYPNATAPMGLMPGMNPLLPVLNALSTELDEKDGTPTTHPDGTPYERCLFVSYDTQSPGEGNATASATNFSSPKGSQFTFQLPAGILAIGDVVATRYAEDYFVVIDLGGADRFEASAGGALLAKMRPNTEGLSNTQTQTANSRYSNTFIAPSLVVNVDPREVTTTVEAGASSRDVYRNATRDFAHGSYFGVLVDTGGADEYEARDASQGVLGGVLLDLDGTDSYKARDLSQGASLASVGAGSQQPNANTPPQRPVDDLPDGGRLPMDHQGTNNLGVHRRSIPGILLDAGEASVCAGCPPVQTFHARSHSQGFARGYAEQIVNATNAPAAYGILASLGKAPQEVYTGTSRFTQGVGGVDGVGILFNLEGLDVYAAESIVSQGSTISQRVYTNDPKQNQAGKPALGVLVDLGGTPDVYTANDPINRTGGSRMERENNLTIQRSESYGKTSGTVTTYTDLGVHLDGDKEDLAPALMGVGNGNGEGGIVGATTPSAAFHVYMPNARLAIGKNTTTNYTQEFAFVVDLGGDNNYSFSAGGFIRERVARVPASGDQLLASGVYGADVTLFPVTLLVDAGLGDSLYQASRAFSQGAGLFSVGVVADIGGRDRMVASPALGRSLGSAYLTSPPVVDGNIGADWDGIPVVDMDLRSTEDDRFSPSGWELRVANDHRSIYLAIKGRTSSFDENLRLRDTLTVGFDMGRRQQEWNHTTGRTGIDQVRLTYEGSGVGTSCKGEDRAFEWRSPTSKSYVADPSLERASLKVACRFTSDGEVFYEIRKDLLVGSAFDPRDLSYCYDETVGFGAAAADWTSCQYPVDELGLFIEFGDAGAGYYREGPGGNQPANAIFTWPPGAADDDGETGHRADRNLTRDEMRSWAAIGLAQLEKDGKVPANVLAPSLSQGVGIAGVGILAMLGTGLGESHLIAGDQSQGYGAYGGLGVVIDSAGSDRYEGGDRTLGAGETRGMGLFMDIDGNDNYRPTSRALGWSSADPAASGHAAFLDLAGDDHYAWRPKEAFEADQARGYLQEPDTQLAPAGNNVFWSQGMVHPALPGTGFGADYRLVDAVRQRVAGVSLDVLFGQTRTNFNVTYHDPTTPGPWGNGCTTREVQEKSGTGDFSDYRVRGTVCFVATVDTGNGNAYHTVRPFSGLGGDLVKDALTANTQNMTVGGRVNVSAVDFLIDRARVASAYTKVALNHTVSRWAAPVDLSQVPDGVARGKALPLFTAELDQDLGVFLFHEDLADYYNETNATNALRTLLVDNPPRPKVALDPDYTGVANATFSAYAVGAKQNLYVNYTVNHDVGEDGYVQHNGWRPHINLTHVPCRDVPETDAQGVPLCNLLPFYLGASGEILTTNPGTDPAPTPARVVTEAEGRIFSAATHALERPLRIYNNDSFYLTIPSRTSLDPTTRYTTEVRLLVFNDTGRQARLGDSVWTLGHAVEEAPKAVPSVEQAQSVAKLLGPVYLAMQENINKQLKLVDDTIASIGGDQGVRNQTNVVYGHLCSTADNPHCRAVSGRPVMAGATDICQDKHPHNFPGGTTKLPVVDSTLGELFWMARATVDNTTYTAAEREVICHAYWDDVNNTADAAGPLASGATTLASQQLANAVKEANELLEEQGFNSLNDTQSRVDGIKFNRIWFDTNKTLPTSANCNSQGECIHFGADGTLVLPRGFRIGLEFGIIGGDGCPVELCSHYANTIGTVRSGYFGTFNSTSGATCTAAGSCVNVTNPAELGPNFDFFNLTVDNQLASQQDGDGQRLRMLIGGQGVPTSFFYVKSGRPLEQPRLEIRVPAEPSTDVEITIDSALTGEQAATLRPTGKIVGDLPGTPTRDGAEVRNATYWKEANESPHVAWNVNRSPRWTENTIVYSATDLPDGEYVVRVGARDGSGQETNTFETLLIDHTAPATFVSTDSFAGKATLSSGAIPVKWAVFEQGSGLREIWLYSRNGSEGDLTTGWWKQGPFPPGVRSTDRPKAGGVDEYLFMTIGIDGAGNVEAAPNLPDAQVPLQTKEEALAAAFAAKLGLGESALGYRRVFVDEGDPRFAFVRIEGGRALSYQGSDFTFVRGGAPLSFAVCALDVESSVGLVNLSLDHIDVATGALRSATFTATDQGPCETNGRLFVSDAWSAVNGDATRFPEGIWAAMFEIFDVAGNRIRVSAGNLILDHDAPTVTLQPPVLPAGQSAVKPGDLVKIRLVAQDDFGVDDGGIRVDASKFARNASALPTKAVRVNGVVYQEAQFTVDLPNLQNGVFEVEVRVPDLAGNVTIVKTQIAVDFKPFEFVPGSLRVSNVTHNALTLHWRTNEPTSALAKFGTTSVALSGRTPQDINLSAEHALRVEGLKPSTHYYLRAVAISAGGFTKESEIIEVDTTSALFLEPVSPVSGDKVSGLVRVKFKGGLLDSTDFVSYTLEVRDGTNASKPWTFLTTATRQGDTHELTWNSTRFLDGTAYQLRLTAVAGTGAAADRASIVIDRLTSDNTPPSVLVLSPLLATNDTTPQLTAEASDALSGLSPSPAQLLVDGTPVEGNLTRELLPGARIRLTYAFEQPLAAGIRTFELRVPDLAGNVAKETWKVAIDGDAPNVTVEPTRFAPGTAAAKRGGTVTLNLTITDLSGVSLVAADTSPLNPQAPETRLVKLVNTDNWQGTVTVAAGDASASKDVRIRAVDIAGNERVVTVTVPVDNVAPTVAATSLADIKHRRAVIDVPANEPILVNGTATAPGSPAVTAATTGAASTARLAFDGLLPSRTYEYRLTAVDRAGNAVDLAGRFATLEDVTPPSAVGPLSVLDLLNGTLRLSWAPATDDVLVSHYRVYRSEDGITFTVVAETETPLYEDWGLPYEKTYVYKVAAVDFGANEGEASPSLRAAATAVPRLTAGTVSPTVGTTTTTFRYTVTYLSPGGVTPTYVRIILDGVPQNMTLESGTAQTGAVYVYETRLAPHKRDAPHTYAFEASDGRYTAHFPEDGEVLRGPLVSGDASGAGDLGGFGAFAQRVPLGGVAGVAMAMLAAVGLAALMRRRKEGSK